jgi:hypothetical protein
VYADFGARMLYVQSSGMRLCSLSRQEIGYALSGALSTLNAEELATLGVEWTTYPANGTRAWERVAARTRNPTATRCIQQSRPKTSQGRI